MLSYPGVGGNAPTIPSTDDSAIKYLPLARGWAALYAGDPSCAIEIADRAKSVLRTGVGRASSEEVKGVMRRAYHEVLRQQLADNFLSRYNMTVEEFKKKGKKLFGNDFELINKPIREFTMATSFLVCGVDALNFPHIISVKSPGGSVRSHDSLGHAAIGTGYAMALASLGASDLRSLSIENLLYRVLLAKFAAESAPGVGKSTILVLWRNGFDRPSFLPADNPLRRAYAAWASDPAPENVKEFFQDSFRVLLETMLPASSS